MNRTLAARVALPLLLLALGTGAAPGCTEKRDLPTPVIQPPVQRPSLPGTYRPSGLGAAGDVAVHLFDWRWDDIATECETVLGPAGFKAVQVSPPNEHSLTPSRDWSERYQPVSYSLARSRSGTGAEFQAMVDRCAAVGVGIYVDAVLNHMTNFPSPGVGSNGTAYSKYDYPGLWTAADFHAPCTVTDYTSATNVQDCELFTLPDLNTGSASVRQKLADYLVSVARMGVAGFRVDAAKHIQQVELDDIFDRMNTTLAGEARALPYVFLEVGIGAGEVLRKNDFFGVGYGTGGAADITEFTVTGVADKFRKVGGQSISQLDPDGPAGAQFSPAAWGLVPSDKAVIFLQNHDTQHNCGIGPADGNAYRLAYVWMLAQPYGYPSVLSSFAFVCPSGNSMGPRSDADGWTLPVSCAASWATASPGDWLCEHRDPHIARMVGFRRRVAGTAITGWWDNDANAIAFSRGDKGFVAINRESASVTVNAITTLPPGTYCDLITGGLVGGACAGTSVTVSAGGSVQFALASDRAIAIDVSTRR